MAAVKSSFVGLKNQGATCYLNSLIQTLFLTPEFRQQLFMLNPDEVGLSYLNDSNNNIKKEKRKKIIVELQKLFARLQCPDFSGEYCSDFALSTKSLTKSFGWDAAQAQDQHDINELYNLLLDGIEHQMPTNKKILKQYYQGKSINVIKCQKCGNSSKRYEEFNQLNIILQDFSKTFDKLQESLTATYLDNTEDLKDDNAYFCNQCNQKVYAKKFCRLVKLPSIMVCNLNRFYFDLESGERVKINKKFSFPKSLDLSMFIDNGMFDIYVDVLYIYTHYMISLHSI